MSIVAETYRYVIGVDTHAEQHTYALITADGAVQEVRAFPTTQSGIGRAGDWVARRTGGQVEAVLVVVEGAGSYGRLAAAAFTRAGYLLAEAPSPTTVHHRAAKSDPIDATRMARQVLGIDVAALARPRAGEAGQLAALLLAERDALVSERTMHINQLTAQVRTHDLGIDARRALSDAQIVTIATWRTRAEDQLSARARAIATRTAKRIGELGTLLAENQTRIDALTRHVLPTVREETGYGAITCARAIAVYSEHGRIRNADAFAALAGTCPIPASSGKHERMRLNRGGDRRLNAATYTIALTRMHHDPATRDYVARRRAEGKTDREIRRALKNYIVRHLYRALKRADLTLTA